MTDIDLTKREKIVIAAAILILIGLFLIPKGLAQDLEYCLTVIIVPPLGFLIATDKERANRKGK